ncbi:MAG: hypothetical protein ACRC1M_01870, partial [Methanobacteriaceae archaeon]
MVSKVVKRTLVILVVLTLLFVFVSGVSAATYTLGNSTDVGVISKMVSGKMPIKAGKFIKNGDVVKFKAGDYRNLTLVVNKKIT